MVVVSKDQPRKVKRWSKGGSGNAHGGWSTHGDDDVSTSSQLTSSTEAASDSEQRLSTTLPQQKAMQRNTMTNNEGNQGVSSKNMQSISFPDEPEEEDDSNVDELLWNSLPHEVRDLVHNMENAVQQLRNRLKDVEWALESKEEENSVLQQQLRKSNEEVRSVRAEAAAAKAQVRNVTCCDHLF